MCRMASTAAWSAAILSPRPTQRAAASAAASVTRTSSRARLRSGVWRCMDPIVCTSGGARLATLRGDDPRARPPGRRRRARPFPALVREVAGQPALYLDGPGGTQVPESVVEAMGASLRDANANLGGAFATSAEADGPGRAHARRARPTSWAASRSEIVLGANMTTLNFLLSRAAARTWRPGDEMVITTARPRREHLALAARRARLRPARAPRAGAARPHARPRRPRGPAHRAHARRGLHAGLERAWARSPTPRASAELAHAAGALAWVDGVHFAPTGASTWGARAATCSCARRTSSSARTPGWPGPPRPLLEGWPADRVRPAARVAARPPLRDRHRRARGAGRASRRRWTTSPRWGRATAARASASTRRSSASRAHEGELGRRLLERPRGHAGRHGARHRRRRADGRARADVRPHRRGDAAARARRGARRGGHLRLGRQLLRARRSWSTSASRAAAARCASGSCTTRPGRGGPRARPPGAPAVAGSARIARPADVAELVDAHGSGPCGGNPVEVQVLSSAPDEGPAQAGFSRLACCRWTIRSTTTMPAAE